MRFSVLTLNLWNISEPLAPRMAALAAGLKTLRPDIVCLQEIELDPRTRRRQSAFAAEAYGLIHAVDSNQLSILSRFPVERSESVALPDVPEDEPRQVLLAEMRIDGRPVLVANTHLSWRPEWLAERKAQADVLLPAIGRFGAPEATILCGDFNDDPDSAAVLAVRDSAIGFRDCYAEASPGNPGLTWVREILTFILRRRGTSASTTSSPPAAWRRRIAPSSLTATTASTSHPIITACSALSNFAPSQR